MAFRARAHSFGRVSASRDPLTLRQILDVLKKDDFEISRVQVLGARVTPGGEKMMGSCVSIDTEHVPTRRSIDEFYGRLKQRVLKGEKDVSALKHDKQHTADLRRFHELSFSIEKQVKQLLQRESDRLGVPEDERASVSGFGSGLLFFNLPLVWRRRSLRPFTTRYYRSINSDFKPLDVERVLNARLAVTGSKVPIFSVLSAVSEKLARLYGLKPNAAREVAELSELRSWFDYGVQKEVALAREAVGTDNSEVIKRLLPGLARASRQVVSHARFERVPPQQVRQYRLLAESLAKLKPKELGGNLNDRFKAAAIGVITYRMIQLLGPRLENFYQDEREAFGWAQRILREKALTAEKAKLN